MTEMAIRRATIADRDEVIRIRALSGWAAYEAIDIETAAAQDSPFWFPQSNKDLGDPGSSAHVVVAAGAVLAIFGFEIEEGDGGDKVGRLSGIYVDPQQQNRGVGTKIVQFVLDAFRAAGCSGAYLFVREKNRGARAFYSRRGWRPDGKTKTVKNSVELTGARAFRYTIEL